MTAIIQQSPTQVRVMPNFLVIGSQRCGTGAFCNNLEKHPDVALSHPRETHFFSDDAKYALGLDWYSNCFSHTTNESAIGDGSVTYSSPHRASKVLPRVQEHVPQCRIIHLARHPIERLKSAWILAQFCGEENRRLNDALREGAFIANSMYWTQLSPYREIFPDDRILTIQFEEYVGNPNSVLRRAFEFLDVDPNVTLEHVHEARNASVTFRRDRIATNRLKNQRHLRWMYDRLPQSCRDWIKRALTAPLDKLADIEAETMKAVVEQIRPDMERYLEYCGKPSDYWRLDQ